MQITGADEFGFGEEDIAATNDITTNGNRGPGFALQRTQT